MIESMVAVGRVLGVIWIVSCCVTAEDQAPSSSCTLKEMVWIPAARDEILKEGSLLKAPEIDEVH
jgi:hypothetical protein